MDHQRAALDEDGHGQRNANTRHGGSKPQRGRRYRGLTCANCRARKVRCEGGQPTCKTCEIYHDECRYDKAPPISQVVAMAKRLQEAEKTLAEMRSQEKGVAASSETASPAFNERNFAAQSPQGQPTASPAFHVSPTNNTTLPEGPATGSAAPASNDMGCPGQDCIPEIRPTAVDPVSHTAPKEPAPTELSVDENGKICYYGPTSAVHDPSPVDSSASQASAACAISSNRAGMRSSLASYSRESATWEEFALGNAALQTGIPRHVMAKLLHLHWTWVSPMFMWVYRPAFVRDMATEGRYYSEFLLTVICAHAAKYQDGNGADLLLARARRLLGTAIQQPSSIPTVQALLQLSARDLAHGYISQAWVYSGVAFRMASDLGLQHTKPDIKGMSPVDLEIRRRLFWSCYFWDKATSLYAGRPPAVTELLHQDTLDLLDDSSEAEMWTPFYGDSLNLTKFTHSQYPPMKSHSVSCFINSCKLSIIISDIITQLYSRRSRTITEAALKDIKTRLDVWRTQSPNHLRYDPENLPALCPPPHLISQNLLYFTTVILAHRPFWSVPAYYQTCISASKSIGKLVLLLESTFGLENITYLMGYCIYTGASAILEDAKNSKDAADATLKTFLRALNAGMKRCPLLERSLNIIVKGLNRPPLHASSAPAAHQGRTDAGGSNSFIPAFPYLGPSASMDFDMDTYLGGANMDSMAMLDCYPEMQIDMGELICPPLT